MRPTTDVSSAKLMMWLKLNLAVQSWVSGVKSSGLSTELCGAPVLSVVVLEASLVFAHGGMYRATITMAMNSRDRKNGRHFTIIKSTSDEKCFVTATALLHHSLLIYTHKPPPRVLLDSDESLSTRKQESP